ncbi:MAG: c-type cytochrome [Blastocatellia bacterium]|nr:c-type cytochrome [Blastocatellia bacterium]
MRNIKTLTLAAVLVLAGGLSACSNEPTPVANNSQPAQPNTPKPVTPISEATKEDPATRVKNLYNGNCASCHGLEGKPQVTFPGIPDFTNADWQKKEKDEELTKSIKNGKGTNMPKYVGPEADVPELLAYVRNLGKGGGAAAPAGGDAKKPDTKVGRQPDGSLKKPAPGQTVPQN